MKRIVLTLCLVAGACTHPAAAPHAGREVTACESADGIHYGIVNSERCFGTDRRVTLPPGMHDSFRECMRDEDTAYYIFNEREGDTCLRPNDHAYRCMLSGANIISTHTIETCRKRGGRVLGLPQEPSNPRQ